MRLIDSHGHVQADAFAGDLPAVLQAARYAGLERLLVPGWDVASSRAALDLVAGIPWADAAVGIHPHASGDADGDAWDAIAAMARDPRVAAIGETGLDFDRLFSPREAQLANVRRHLRLAIETGKPAILHCRSAAGERDAQDTLIAELRSAGLDGPVTREAFGDRPPALLHSFSGPLDYAEAALEMGLAISISGLAFRKGEEATADVVRAVPADRILVETDCPWLAPPGAPRRRNAPEWVRITAAWVADVRGVAPETLGDDLVAAYDRTFPSPRFAQRGAG